MSLIWLKRNIQLLNVCFTQIDYKPVIGVHFKSATGLLSDVTHIAFLSLQNLKVVQYVYGSTLYSKISETFSFLLYLKSSERFEDNFYILKRKEMDAFTVHTCPFNICLHASLTVLSFSCNDYDLYTFWFHAIYTELFLFVLTFHQKEIFI